MSQRVLIVDDDDRLRRATARSLRACGFDADSAANGVEALEHLARGSYDCIVSDIAMPGMDGMELLRNVREFDLDVPVVIITGTPSIETAVTALQFGAMHYLQKPVSLADLEEVVNRGVKLSALARVKRQALALHGGTPEAGDLAGLETCFDRALERLWIAYQPIVLASEQRVCGYEALLRSAEESLPGPAAILSAAERLHRLPALGRRIREAAPRLLESRDELLFVNLHPDDLSDESLYDDARALSKIASQVVLEITERAPLDGVKNIRPRIQKLRNAGFRIAIDDLGAGYAGLNTFASVEPDIVKLDMSLTRDIHESDTKKRIVSSMILLCRDLGTKVVAEGIETTAERDVLVDLGVDMLQGFLFGKPQRNLSTIDWSPRDTPKENEIAE